MNFTIKNGLTHPLHLAQTMAAQTSLSCKVDRALEIIRHHVEQCFEIRAGQLLCGYVLLINVGGQRSLHGFKLIKGHGIKAFEIARKLAAEYPDAIISTTTDKHKAIGLAKLMGFRETDRLHNIVKMERTHA